MNKFIKIAIVSMLACQTLGVSVYAAQLQDDTVNAQEIDDAESADEIDEESIATAEIYDFPQMPEDEDESVQASCISGGLKYYTYTNGTASVYGYDGTVSGALTIPSYVTDDKGKTYIVNEVRLNAFKSCPELTSLSFPTGLEYIGAHAFEDCTGLKGTLNIPNGVKEIEASAFEGCTGLEGLLEIPSSVEKLKADAFRDCSGFKELIINNGVTEIGASAFNGCTGISGEIVIPSSVMAIWNGAFANCSNVKIFNMQCPISEIKDDVFNGCTSLESVNIPESVTTIRMNVFRNCIKLNKITIPASVTYCHQNILFGCTGLKYVYNESEYNDIKLPVIEGAMWFNRTQKKADVAFAYTGTSECSNIYKQMINPPATIDYRGRVVVAFPILDMFGNPNAGYEIKYKCSDGKGGTCVSNDDGLVYLYSGEKYFDDTIPASNSGTLTFVAWGYSDDIILKNISAEYTVTPVTYKDSYEAGVKFGVKGSVGLSAGANVGAAGAKASLAEAAITGRVGSTLLFENEKNQDGTSTISLEQAYNLGVTGEVEAGPSAKVNTILKNEKAEVKALTAGAEGNIGGEKAFGITLEGITDVGSLTDEQKLKIGKYLLGTTAYNSPDPISKIIVQTLDVTGHPYYDYASYRFVTDGSAGVQALTASVGNIEASAAELKAGATMESNFTRENTGKQTNTYDFSTNLAVGLGVLSFEDKMAVEANMLSAELTNDFDVETVRNNGVLEDVSIGQVMGKSAGGFFNSCTYSRETRFRNSAAHQVAAAAPTVDAFSQSGTSAGSGFSFPKKTEIINAMENLQRGIEADYSDTKTYADFIPDISIDVGAKLGLGLEGSVDIAAIHEKEYILGSGTYNYDEELKRRIYRPTSQNNPYDYGGGFSFAQLIESTIDRAAEVLKDNVDTVKAAAKEGLISSAVTIIPGGNFIYGAYSAYKWVVTYVNPSDEVIQSGMPSYEIDTIGNLDSEGLCSSSKPTVQRTVGRFVNISLVDDVYGETVDNFYGYPVEISINYTDADIEAAGAAPEDISSMKIYRLDNNSKCYVLEEGNYEGNVDVVNKCVKANIHRSGMYVIGIDTVKPEVEGVYVTNNTSRPTIVARINEMSDFSEYSLKLDGKEVVNKQNYRTYYRTDMRAVVYKVNDELSLGEHVVSLYAVDAVGNQMETAYEYYFTVEPEVVQVESVSLTLAEDIAPNFYMYLSEDVVKNGYVMINDKRYAIPSPMADGTYKFTMPVNAKELGDEIVVSVYGSNGMVSLANENSVDGKYTFCIRDYINQVRHGGDTLAELAVALDNYGICAQRYFGYNTSEDVILPEIEEVSIADSMHETITGELPEGVEYLGSSLVLKDRVSVRHYFSGDLANCYITVGGRTAKAIKSGDRSYVEVPGIKPVDLDESYRIGVDIFSMSYCPYSYIDKALTKSDDDDLINLVKSLYWYGEKADRYFN